MNKKRISNQRNIRIVRRKWAKNYLGGKCKVCGITKGLEFDHIDPKTKVCLVSSLFSSTLEVILVELKKCQLLCKKHHIAKSLAERGQLPARGTHGTLSSYRYCKCQICRNAQNKWARNYYNYGPRQEPQHGTKVMYSHHGCRCEVCKKFNTELARRYREKIKSE